MAGIDNIFGYKPKFEFEKFLVPSVKFINKGRDVHNFIIALAL